jgi:peptide/nickel transport system substrate-binding protein
LFNGLVRLDEDLNIVPDLAESWTISKDGLNYNFNIKNEVYFHESQSFGEDLTRTVNANDFEFSFKRLKNPKLGSPGMWALENIKSFKAENDSIFSINLKKTICCFFRYTFNEIFFCCP